MKQTIRFANSSSALALVLGLFGAATVRGGDAAPQAGLKLLGEGFTAPIVLTSLADGSGRLLLADQAGVIYVLNRDGQRQEKPFLDLKDKLGKFNQGMDRGWIFGLGLHPQFKTNRKFYVDLSGPRPASPPAGWDHTMRLCEVRV